MRNLLRIVSAIFFLATVSTQAVATEPGAKPVQSFHDCKGCPEMVVIPSGDYYMGVGGVRSASRFTHFVKIQSPFALSRTEVTQGQWRAIMGNNPSINSRCGDSCPVENVNWPDVQEFIKKLNAVTGKQYRLPSEAEWEYACREGKQEKFCGSEDADGIAWYEGNSDDAIHPVATKQANVWGIYDMSGNVLEWVADSWHKHAKHAPNDGSVYKGEDDDDSYHVVRGGAFNDAWRNVDSTTRNYSETDFRGGNIGFRLAKSDATASSSEKILPKAIETRVPPKQTEVAPVSAKVNDSVDQKLRDLHNLQKDGVITEEEYQVKKKQLLESY